MMEEVAKEEQVMHDVFGCADCYIDPHNSHVSYCLLSVYNPFHPSHICLVMYMVIFRTIFFELLVFFTFTLLTLHSAY